MQDRLCARQRSKLLVLLHAAGPCGHPSTQRGKLDGVRLMTACEALLVQLTLQLLSHNASLNHWQSAGYRFWQPELTSVHLVSKSVKLELIDYI